MGSATGGCVGDNAPSLLWHVPCRGYNKIQIRLHILTDFSVAWMLCVSIASLWLTLIN